MSHKYVYWNTPQELREEVTAILTHQALNSEIETEVVLTLQTGGGTVTGYGMFLFFL